MKNLLTKILFPIVLLLSFINCFGQTQTLSLTGLKDKVTVRRDERSIPYIEAKSDADLYFAQGFVTASDRLWQMDLLRRVARGETAEIFGKDALDEDKHWRRYGFSKIADDTLLLLSPDVRNALENYARGVNAYIAASDEKSLPIEFQILRYKPAAWKATDSIITGKILAEGLSSTWRNDLIRASLQKLPKEKFNDLVNPVTPDDVVLFGNDFDKTKKLTAETPRRGENLNRDRQDILDNFSLSLPILSVPANSSSLRLGVSAVQIAVREEAIRKKSLSRVGFYAEELAASNNWVISGKRTADGLPVLANDPHLQASAPGIWYLTHLAVPNMRISGVTIPGVPGIVLGHNDWVAWGATNVGPDVQDLYIEKFDTNGNYKTPKGWEKPVIRKEEIKVRKNSLSAETETQILELTETQNGLIITEQAGQKFALKWTARDPKNNEFEAFYYLNRAKNWEDFKNALKGYGGATQNFVYADVKGNIGWYAAGKIPIRRTGNGALPYDGATNAGDWIGYIPFTELPNLYNPKEGFIVTANQRIVGANYKYQQISRDAAPPWRARRIYDLILANPKITMDDASKIQLDVFNIPLSNLAREIVKLEAASPETLAVLRSWDGKMTADSRGALLVNAIRSVLADKLAEEAAPAPSWIIRERILDWVVKEKPARWLPKQFANYAEFLKAGDKEARKNLAQRFGAADESKWIWGENFKSRFPHPLVTAPFIGGQFATPNVSINGSGQTPNVGSSVSMRHITSPGNWDATRHVIPLGQSGDPRSPFWKNQFDAWRTGTPQIFPYSKEAVLKATKETVVLMPK